MRRARITCLGVVAIALVASVVLGLGHGLRTGVSVLFASVPLHFILWEFAREADQKARRGLFYAIAGSCILVFASMAIEHGFLLDRFGLGHFTDTYFVRLGLGVIELAMALVAGAGWACTHWRHQPA